MPHAERTNTALHANTSHNAQEPCTGEECPGASTMQIHTPIQTYIRTGIHVYPYVTWTRMHTAITLPRESPFCLVGCLRDSERSCKTPQADARTRPSLERRSYEGTSTSKTKKPERRKRKCRGRESFPFFLASVACVLSC